MSDTQHTPGPWIFEVWDYTKATPSRQQELGIQNARFRLAVLDCDFLGGNPYTIPYEEALANARLIAASPDLLSAGRAALSHLDHIGVGTVVVALRAAIAKAKGE